MCEKCPKREKCKTLCKKVKAYLFSEGIRASNYIRPRLPRSAIKRLKKQGETNNLYWREIPFSALPTEDDSKDPLLTDLDEK